jgi:hypothetical protein
MTTRPNYQLSEGLMLFSTAYDPLDLASDSIDPLGFLRGYLALAYRLLPGFTTVTSVPRYLPMLCAGMRAAERLHPRGADHEPAKARGRRLEVLRNFEKVWALACGLAEKTRGKPAIAGLRGIRYVRRFLEANAARSEINVGDFNLLANQVRYGGIGTYGQMLEACHFADWTVLALRPLGEILADAFPSSPFWSPERPNARIAKETLRSWGEGVCCSEHMTTTEAKTICKGLSGGLEAERDDDVRWNCLRLLKAYGQGSGAGEEFCLKRFCSVAAPGGDARKSMAVRQLRLVTLLIEPFEELYQSSLFLFNEMSARATEDPMGCSLASLSESGEVANALDTARRSQEDLRNEFADAEQVDAAVTAPIVSAMRDSGILALADLIATADTVGAAARILLQRHAAVQSGKFDRGQQKSPSLWLDNGRARLSAQRHGLPKEEHVRSWRDIPRHTYRTSAAGNFVRECRIA